MKSFLSIYGVRSFFFIIPFSVSSPFIRVSSAIHSLKSSTIVYVAFFPSIFLGGINLSTAEFTNPAYVSIYSFSFSSRYFSTFDFRKVEASSLFSQAIMLMYLVIPLFFLNLIISATVGAIISSTLAPTAVVIRSVSGTFLFIPSRSPDSNPHTFFTVSVLLFAPTVSTVYSLSLFSWDMISSFTSINVTLYEFSESIFPIKPLPILPAPK